MRKILKGAVVLLIAFAMVFSTAALANTQTKEETIELSTIHSGSANGARGSVVWDNGMEYDGLAAAQNDEGYPFSCYVADDFHFDIDTEVADVHWIGGYWNGNPAEFDWCISFYYDDGSGESPAGTPYNPSFIGPICFAWADIVKEDLGSGYYQMSVDLPETITFTGCEKFWISIWGYGLYPPQSGWGMHQVPVTLTPAVWGSDFFGFPFWTPGFDVQGYDHDMCFQLTGPTQNSPPGKPTIEGPANGDAGETLTFTFSAVDPDGDNVRFIIDWGDTNTDTTGYVASGADKTASHVWTTPDTYTITAYAEDEAGLAGPSASFSVTIPRIKQVNSHPFLQFLQSHPNMFPLLKLLLQRL